MPYTIEDRGGTEEARIKTPVRELPAVKEATPPPHGIDITDCRSVRVISGILGSGPIAGRSANNKQVITRGGGRKIVEAGVVRIDG